MSRIEIALGGLILAIMPMVSNAEQLQMPPLLTGTWADITTVLKADECGSVSKARGITITPDGAIMSNVGDRTCKLKELRVELFPDGDILGAWSYSGECVVRNSHEVRTVPMFGWMRLMIDDSPDKRTVLSRDEAQVPLPSNLWEARPRVDVERQYRRCS